MTDLTEAMFGLGDEAPPDCCDHMVLFEEKVANGIVEIRCGNCHNVKCWINEEVLERLRNDTNGNCTPTS